MNKCIYFLFVLLIGCTSEPQEVRRSNQRNDYYEDILPAKEDSVLSKLHFGMSYLEFLKVMKGKVDSEDYYKYLLEKGDIENCRFDADLLYHNLKIGGVTFSSARASFDNGCLSKLRLWFPFDVAYSEDKVDDYSLQPYLYPFVEGSDFNYGEKPKREKIIKGMDNAIWVKPNLDEMKDSLENKIGKANLYLMDSNLNNKFNLWIVDRNQARNMIWYSKYQMIFLKNPTAMCGTLSSSDKDDYMHFYHSLILEISPYNASVNTTRLYWWPYFLTDIICRGNVIFMNWEKMRNVIHSTY